MTATAGFPAHAAVHVRAFYLLHSRGVPDPDAEENTQPGAEPDMEALMELVERAINGVELPDYAGVPDSGAPAGPPITSSARP